VLGGYQVLRARHKGSGIAPCEMYFFRALSSAIGRYEPLAAARTLESSRESSVHSVRIIRGARYYFSIARTKDECLGEELAE